MAKRLIARPQLAWILSLFREDAGDSLVELGLILAFFCTPLLVGTGEMGLIVYDSIQIQNAANSAAEYAMQSATLAADTAGITSAARADAPALGAALTVTPTVFYVCSATIGGTKYTGANALSNATAACTGTSNHPLQFVQVNTSATVTPTLRCPGFASTFAVVGPAVREVEQ